jgi:hypothetical protein
MLAWALQLFGELRLSLQKGSTVWPVQDVEEFIKLKPEAHLHSAYNSTLHPGILQVPAEKMKTVTHFLDELGTTSVGDAHSTKLLYFTLPHPPAETVDSNPTTLPPKPAVFTIGGFDIHVTLPNVKHRRVPAVPHCGDDGPSLGQTVTSFKWAAPAIHSYQCLRGPNIRDNDDSHTIARFPSPVRGVGFSSFRKLGFAIWDRKRMSHLGLLPEEHSCSFHVEHFYFFAWQILLDVEEVKRVKATLQAKYEAVLEAEKSRVTF